MSQPGGWSSVKLLGFTCFFYNILVETWFPHKKKKDRKIRFKCTKTPLEIPETRLYLPSEGIRYILIGTSKNTRALLRARIYPLFEIKTQSSLQFVGRGDIEETATNMHAFFYLSSVNLVLCIHF